MEEQTEPKRSVLLLPLIAITVLFLLGVFFFVLGKDRAAAPTVPEANRADSKGTSAQMSQDALDFERAVTQYAQLLPEVARESADGQSVEATGAQEVLRKQTAIVARSLSGNVLTKGGVTVPTEQIAEALEQFNISIVEYATLARAGLVDETKVNAAVEELNEVFNTKSGQEKARIEDALLSYKNAVTESVRSFAQERYAESYQKQLESQEASRQLFILVRG